jgi:uncharacterized protein YndB with AHSA1/START domain
MKEQDHLVIVRKFNAAREVVFEAFANREAMAEWWGPAGMKVTVKSFDFEEGGKFHYKMEANGGSMWGLFKYVTIERPGLIEFINSFSDEQGNICESPFPIDLPLEIFYKIILIDMDGITTLILTGYPVNASADQEAAFISINTSMHEGFGGTFDQLDRYLERKG